MIGKLTAEKPATLIYSPYWNNPALYDAIQKFSSGWPWVDDCCLWVTREEADALISDGLLKPESGGWKVHHYGLICTEYGMTFTGVKDRLLQGISDFADGWFAASKAFKPLELE